MRARSALQRFPVAQWVEDLDTLQTTSIKLSKEGFSTSIPKSSSMVNMWSLMISGLQAHPELPQPLGRHPSSLNVPGTPGSVSGPWIPPIIKIPSPGLLPGLTSSLTVSRSQSGSSSPVSVFEDDILLPPTIFTPGQFRGSTIANTKIQRFSKLSYNSVAGERKDFALQKVHPSFTDGSGVFSRAFEKRLEMLGGKSSENVLCIEENLIKSEKEFFNSYRDAKMGFSTTSYSGSGSSALSRPQTPTGSFFDHSTHDSVASNGSDELLNGNEDFVLGKDYKSPTGLKRFMLYKVGEWPIYALGLAFGQIIAANSYQITLLIGEIGQTAEQLYVVASIYAVSSIVWWTIFRRLESVYVLSLPFAFYGLAFFLIAMALLATNITRGWIQRCFGMILLQTMTRFHISFTLIAAQVLGSVATILARLTAPDRTGPGDVFPNFALGTEGLGKGAFWLGLGMQLVVCCGFALFFRKEQLAKP